MNLSTSSDYNYMKAVHEYFATFASDSCAENDNIINSQKSSVSSDEIWSKVSISQKLIGLCFLV